MNNVNYQKELEKILDSITDPSQKLLLHSCCAPCSSYCLIYLLPYFDITCFYYNPNITGKEEYDKRRGELHRLVDALNEEYDPPHKIKVIDGEYESDLFIEKVKEQSLEGCPEGGTRCGMCFDMRLRKTYERARADGFDLFTTTLTISPHKNAQLINSIGSGIASGNDGPVWLPADFKKNDGYKRSIELSAKYELYRQSFCGCVYSL